MDWLSARQLIASNDRTVRATLCNGSKVDARWKSENGPNYPISLLWVSAGGTKQDFTVGPDFFLGAGAEWAVC